MTNDVEKVKKDLLSQSKTIAILGLSDKSHRTSNLIGQYLLNKGYNIVPVNPKIREALGQKAYDEVKEVPEAVDLVCIFRKNHDLLEVIRQAQEKDIPAVWIQPGIECPEEAVTAAVDQKIKLIQGRCIKVEHRKLFP